MPKRKRRRQHAPSSAESQALVYVRVSTKEQVTNLSLETQEERCLQESRKLNSKAVRVFSDGGYSAKTTDRPGLQALFEYLRKHPGQVQYVIVYSLDRLTRDTGDYFKVRERLLDMGVKLRSVTQPIDETSNGVLIGGMASVYSHWDNVKRSERTTEGMQKRIEKGGWPFMSSLGYIKVESAVTGTTLAPDPLRAPLIRLAFELMATGAYKVSDVVKVLKQRGLRTRKNRTLSAQSLGQILQRPVYAGLLKAEGWTQERWGDFEPIVTPDLFEKVQNVLSGRQPTATTRSRGNPDFPLRGFVFCTCGRPLTASWCTGRHGDTFPYYKCHKCRGTLIRGEKLEQQFVSLLDALTPRQEALTLFFEVVSDVWKNRQAAHLQRSRTLEQAKLRLKAERDRVFELLKERTIGTERWREEDERIEERLQEIDAEISLIRTSALDVEPVLRFAKQVSQAPADFWVKSDLEARQRFQQLLFARGSLTLRDKRVETQQKSLFFQHFGDCERDFERVVDLTGVEPVTS